MPFGPFLALGGMIAFFVGNEIVDAYLDTLLSAASGANPRWTHVGRVSALGSGPRRAGR